MDGGDFAGVEGAVVGGDFTITSSAAECGQEDAPIRFTRV